VTREQLDAIRARVEASTTCGLSTQIEIDRDGTTRWVNVGPYPCATHEDAAQVRDLVTFVHQSPTDLRALLAEVERLRDAHAMAVQVSGEMCEKCGWAMKFPSEKCRCELLTEVERLTVERDLARLNRDLEAKAFREECTLHGTTRSRVQDAISVLWHRGRIELRLDDATTTTALADALVGVFNEVERLTAEVEAKTKQNVALIGQNGRLQQEVERLTADPLPAAAWVREVERAAFKRGVAAMREAARMSFVSEAEKWRSEGDVEMEIRYLRLAGDIRSLPDPEDKP